MSKDIVKHTKVSTDDLVDTERAMAVHKHVLELKRRTAMNFLDLGKAFAEIKTKKLYEAFSCETFEEYLGTPELSFDRSTVFALIRIFETYVMKLGMPEKDLVDIHWSKLHKIAPVVTVANAEDMLEKARTLSRSSLQVEVDSMKSHPNYTGEIGNEGELDMEGIRAKCPIGRGSICPLIKKYRNDILKEHNDKKKTKKMGDANE